MINLGKKIQYQRLRRILSVRKLAKAADVKELTIRDIESGKRPHPRRETVERIASALGLTIEQLVDTEIPEDSFRLARAS